MLAQMTVHPCVVAPTIALAVASRNRAASVWNERTGFVIRCSTDGNPWQRKRSGRRPTLRSILSHALAALCEANDLRSRERARLSSDLVSSFEQNHGGNACDRKMRSGCLARFGV
jgi:hypothetical protein